MANINSTESKPFKQRISFILERMNGESMLLQQSPELPSSLEQNNEKGKCDGLTKGVVRLDQVYSFI